MEESDGLMEEEEEEEERQVPPFTSHLQRVCFWLPAMVLDPGAHGSSYHNRPESIVQLSE